MTRSFDKAVEKCREVMKFKVSPFNCLYRNPRKYGIVEFARWTQKYLNYKIYVTLLESAKITGFEPVPSELLNRHVARNDLSGRKVKVGKLLFYLLRTEEMSKSLLTRYQYFRELVLK